MPEILVISGKGGTGKTSLTAAFAFLAGDKVVCDLDVDAPDLHLLLEPQPFRSEDFHSGNEAVIDQQRCTGCGECARLCRFRAAVPEGGVYRIDPVRCEGCSVCVHFCPENAVGFPQRHCGQWYVSDTRLGPLVHAQLFPGQENSGRLVALLRQQARELAEARGAELILSDGPPGIGCPVISSLSGTDLAVAVTEPTLSGIHDLERVVELCRHFQVPAAVIVNQCDLNPEHTAAIRRWCRDQELPLLAELPHDPDVTRAMVRRQTVTEYTQSPLTQGLERAWREISGLAGLARAAQGRQGEQDMSQIVAFPSSHPGGLDAALGAHFGHCDLYTLVEVDQGAVVDTRVIPNVPHQQGGCLAPVQHLADHGVKVLVAGGMGLRPLMGFNQVGIDVYYGGASSTVGQAVASLLEGRLPRFEQQHTCGGGHAA